MRSLTSFSLEPEKKNPLVRGAADLWCIATNLHLFALAVAGQCRQFFSPGTADPAVMRIIREKAKKYTGDASIAKIDPDAGLLEVQQAIKKTINDIEGFKFLKYAGEHTVLIKIGVNWGFGGYPTVTSPESIYAVIRLCLEAANRPRKVIIGDESGIEVKNMGFGSTKDNFGKNTGVMAAAGLAGLHHAAAMEGHDSKFRGAGELAGKMGGRHGHFLDRFEDMSAEVMKFAERAGVIVMPFNKEDHPNKIKVCYQHPDKIKYFKDDKKFLIPKVVAEEITDIINLPKPPGRHSILGNEGLSGAVKNYVGLMDGDQRMPYLHNNEQDPIFTREKGQDEESHKKNLRGLAEDLTRPKKNQNQRFLRKSAHSYFRSQIRKRTTPDMVFHEKIAEIYLAFADKERFCVTDMRKTMSAIGPDFGANIDIGAVIAASDALTLDAIAGAFLKKRYEEIGKLADAVQIGGDSVLEYLVGRTWLKKGSPFDLKSHIAVNSYGLGPCDLEHIEFKGLENSGFRVSEIEGLARCLGAKRVRSHVT